MTDKKIIEPFFARDESAISEADNKYGAYCHTVASRILGNDADADECVNDTLFAAWNSIPPQKPDDLGSYLSAITRNISAKRLRKNRAAKRGGGEADIAIDELDQCLGDVNTPEQVVLSAEFTAVIERFLDSLPKKERDMFVCRYYYAYPTAQIASAFGYSDGYVRSVLSRIRTKLGEYLTKENML